MERVESNRLYKFASLESAKQIILSGKLKFTRPIDFNDPFDCNIDRLKFDLTNMDDEFRLYHDKRQAEAKRIHGERAKEINWSEFYEKVQTNKVRKARVCCFSTTYDHPLLWAHYGDKHLGACLMFENDPGKRFINEDKLRIGIEGMIQYKEFEQVNFCTSRVNAYTNLFMVKGLDWEYEREYRIISHNSKEEFIDFEPNFFKGIIFGLKVKNKAITSFKEEILKKMADVEWKVALKNNEDVEIVNWNFESEIPKGFNVSVLSTDPKIKGFFDRLNSE